MVRACSCLVAGLLISVATRADAQPDSGGKVWFLTSPTALELDQRALLDAVSIYTRDLRLQVEERAGAPTTITPESLEQVVALVRASGARLAFWYRLRPEEHDLVLYAVTVDGAPDVHALKVAGLGTPEIYRVVALKIRSVLTGAARYEPQVETPPLPAVSAPAPPPAATPLAPPPRNAAPPAASTASPAYRPRALLAAGYRLALPLATDLLRHGIAVEGVVPIGRHVEIHVSVELSTQPERQLSTGAASLFDIPLRVGARAFLRARRVSLGLGAVVSAHVLSISAVGFDGTRGDVRTATAGLGGEVVGRARISDHLAAELRFLVEAIVPATRFLLRGLPSVETGSVLFGLGTGLSFGVP